MTEKYVANLIDLEDWKVYKRQAIILTTFSV